MKTARYDWFAEFAGKALLLAIFGAFATLKIIAITSQLASWSEIQDPEKYLNLVAQASGLAFLILLLVLTFIRWAPTATAQGLEPRVSALAGTFLAMALVALPPADLGWATRLIAAALVCTGWVLSIFVLSWLGRSFSVTAQARRLVTEGPYSIIRHPLYVCEEIALIGMVLLCLSPAAIAIAVVQWMFQLRRMSNEEKVLTAAFPDYRAYAARTPMVIPNPWLWRGTRDSDRATTP